MKSIKKILMQPVYFNKWIVHIAWFVICVNAVFIAYGIGQTNGMLRIEKVCIKQLDSLADECGALRP